MRKLMCLMLVLSGLGVGCSDDDDKGNGAPPTDGDGVTEETAPATGDDENAADGTDVADAGDGMSGGDGDGDGVTIPDDPSNGGGDDVVEPKYPDCQKEMIAAEFDPYVGDKPFSREDYAACGETCGGMGQACVTEENCPGWDAFNACVSTNVINCSAKADGMCRVAYENFVCCAVMSGCDQEDFACLQQACGEDIGAFQTCLRADTACSENEEFTAQCFGDDTVGGDEPDASTGGEESDAGVDMNGDEAINGDVSNGDGALFTPARLNVRALLRHIAR